jgi:hypothetical protein
MIWILKKINLKPLLTPVVDLCIVIIGVSVAFLLNSYNEQKKEERERQKVLASLEMELNTIIEYFPTMATYQTAMAEKWDSLLVKDTIADFYNYYYLQPQYNYSIIEYAIESRNGNIVNFTLHQKLLKLYKRIKMLEQSEIHMTNLALQYQAVGHNKKVSPQNLFLFNRFIFFARSRALGLTHVNELALETLPLVKN